MDDVTLPESSYLGDDVSWGFDAEDLRDYGAACAAAERARVIDECVAVCVAMAAEFQVRDTGTSQAMVAYTGRITCQALAGKLRAIAAKGE